MRRLILSISCVLALGAARFARTLLFGLEPTDPTTVGATFDLADGATVLLSSHILAELEGKPQPIPNAVSLAHGGFRGGVV